MFDKYIGIPFKNRHSSMIACDCYGLVRIIYKDILKIDIPQPTSSAFESKHIEDEYLKETSKNWSKVSSVQKFDVVAMKHDPKHPDIVQHFGIAISETKMIHTLKGIGSHIVNISEYDYFIEGYYRYG